MRGWIIGLLLALAACEASAPPPSAPAVALTVDEDAVYWITASGELLRAPKEGGDEITLATGIAGADRVIAVDSRNVYVNGESGLSKIDKRHGGEARPIAERVEAVTAGGDRVYWSTGTIIAHAPAESGPETRLFGQLDLADALAVDDTHVYWVDRLHGKLMRARLDGTEVTQLDELAGDRAPVLVVTRDHVFWGVNDLLHRLDKAGGAVTPLARGLGDPLLSDGAFLYGLGAGAVLRMPIEGGEPVALVTGIHPTALALDEDHVYWSDAGDGAIHRAELDSPFRGAPGVPPELLRAIARVETGGQMIEGVGLMALAGERLERGAALAGVTVDEALRDPAANVRAAAALLRAHADELGLAHGAGALELAPAVATFSGLEGPAAEAYVDDVYRTLRPGLTLHAKEATLGGPDYPSAIWRPSPNQNPRPFGEEAMIIIHSCEGNYAGCWGWLANASSQASAHYVVNGDGTEISQLVPESERAWHISAKYDCTLNGGVECQRNGAPSNDFTIGIEHAGFAKQTSWNAGLIDASARLVCDIARRHGIPIDEFHIVAHGKLQPWNRSDPGAGWPWQQYLDKIRAACSQPAIVVDSSNLRNDPALARFEVTPRWFSSATIPGYYGTGYRYAATSGAGTPADGATFWFHLDAPALKIIDAWWTTASKRSAAAPFRAYDAAGNVLGQVTANQSLLGGRWNTLGSWRFTAGWNRVVLGRDAPTGNYVIADALRVR